MVLVMPEMGCPKRSLSNRTVVKIGPEPRGALKEPKSKQEQHPRQWGLFWAAFSFSGGSFGRFNP